MPSRSYPIQATYFIKGNNLNSSPLRSMAVIYYRILYGLSRSSGEKIVRKLCLFFSSCYNFHVLRRLENRKIDIIPAIDIRGVSEGQGDAAPSDGADREPSLLHLRREAAARAGLVHLGCTAGARAAVVGARRARLSPANAHARECGRCPAAC